MSYTVLVLFIFFLLTINIEYNSSKMFTILLTFNKIINFQPFDKVYSGHIFTVSLSGV